MGLFTTKRLAAAAILALSSLAASAGPYGDPNSGTYNSTPSKCAGTMVGPLLDGVYDAIMRAWYANPTRDQAGLLSKLSNANSKTLAKPPKWGDANDKLDDIVSAVTLLENAAKAKLIQPSGSTTIQEAVGAAQACIF